MLSIIVAVAQNGVIGKDNQLLWRLSADLKYFKNLTSHHAIIMGRKTFESIGKPLPNRINIVVSRNSEYAVEGIIIVNSLEKGIETAKKLQPNEDVFVIGGGNIYTQAIPKADKIYITEVKTIIDGDTFFAPIDLNLWKEISRESHKADDKNEYDFDFVVYEKI